MAEISHTSKCGWTCTIFVCNIQLALRGSTVSYAGVAHFPKHSLEYSLNFWSQSKKISSQYLVSFAESAETGPLWYSHREWKCDESMCNVFLLSWSSVAGDSSAVPDLAPGWKRGITWHKAMASLIAVSVVTTATVAITRTHADWSPHTVFRATTSTTCTWMHKW